MIEVIPSLPYSLYEVHRNEQALLFLQQTSVLEMAEKRIYCGRLGHLITQCREEFPKVPYSSQCYLYIQHLN